MVLIFSFTPPVWGFAPKIAGHAPAGLYTRIIYSSATSPLELLRLCDDVEPLEKESAMLLDLAFIAAGISFFVLSAGYARICDRL